MYDYLVVGAGFSGATLAERLATISGKKVLIIDKRDHIGGNAYDYYDEHGILVHKYGPHWFHTNDEMVFNYLSKFTEWRQHEHKVKACVNGMSLPFPINMDTLNQLYGLKLTSSDEVQAYYDSVKIKINRPSNAEEIVTSQVGKDLYKLFFEGYTVKQWDLHPRDLDASVTARIPTRTNRDDRYFSDRFQGLPKNGYTEMIKNMLQHPNITIKLNTDYKDIINSINYDKLIYTGAIDSFFNYKFGKLPYRTLKFEHEIIFRKNYQECQQINYPNDYTYTRIIEWKHATGQIHPYTCITKEYSFLADDETEKFYPIPRPDNHKLFKKYKKEADRLDTVIFCGRLADYKYYNMDQVIARALHIFKNLS